MLRNGLYDAGREGFLDGSINWASDTVKVVLIDLTQYTPDFALDRFLSDIPAPARVAISSALSGKTCTAGVADADDVTFVALTGSTVTGLAIFSDTGSPATSRLIALLQVIASGFPVIPYGGNLTIPWSDGPSKIFKL